MLGRRGNLREHRLAGLLDPFDERVTGHVERPRRNPFQDSQPRIGRPQNDERIVLRRQKAEHPPRILQIDGVDTEPLPAGIKLC